MSSVRSTSLVLSCLVVLILCRWTAGKSCSKSCPSPLVLYTANCVCVPSFVQCFRQDETDCPAVTKAKFCNTPTYMVSCPHSCGLCKSDYVPSSKLAIAFFPSGKSALDLYLGNCGAPPRLANGICRATHGKLADVATCACNRGYNLAGHGLSHCQKNGKWSAHASTCVIKNCGSPPVVARATVSAPVTTYGAKATYTCNVGFRLRSSPYSICNKDGSWTAMGRICTHFVYRKNLMLVLRIAPRNGVSSVATWKNDAIAHDSPLLSTSIQPGCFVMQKSKACSTHFKSSIVKSWEKAGIQEVFVILSKSGRSRYIRFDGRGTNRWNWFRKSRIISSSWSRMKSQRYNKFGISMYGYRNWYINKQFGRCSRDYGWLVVKDTARFGPCTYDRIKSFPVIRFSSSKYYSNTRGYKVADAMAVYVKLASDVCGPPPTLKGATVAYSSIAIGAKATYSCLKFWARKNSPVITCQTDGTWTSLKFTCSLHDCGAPKALPNAVSSSRSTTVGQIATYTCKTGYTASGTRTILCKAGGTWTTTNFKCSIKSCGTPTAVTDATVSAPTTTFGSTATYTCNQGFTRRSGYLKVVCLSSARWSTTNLKCSKFVYINGYVLGMRIIPGNGVSSANTWKNPSIKLDFPVPASLQPGCLGFDTRLPCKTHFRSTLVNYWSKIGLQRVRVVLLKNRKAVRTLDFNAKRTNYLSWFSRSKLIRSTWKNLPYRYSMNHFKILGPSAYRNWYINRAWRGCSNDDGWLVVKDTAAGYCSYDKGKSFPRIMYSNYKYHERATGYATADTMLILLKLATDVCGPPPAVPNSKVAFPSLAVNTVATYTCNAGYNLIGKATARCLSDGKREAPAFSCKKKDCGKPPAITHATVAVGRTTFSSIARYTCNQGYRKRSGSTTIACQANGKWAASKLRCSYFVYMGDYILAMRIVSGNRVSSLSTWNNKKIFYDAPISKSLPAGCLPGNRALPCTKHFRSVLVNNWSKIGVKQIRVLIVKSRRVKKRLVFNGVGSSSTSWFSKSRLVASSWTDLGKRSRTNFFSMKGPRSFRRWYINRYWGGCSNDWGWLLVKDSASASCSYDKGSSFPRIQYSHRSTRDRSTRYATADAMLILLKLAKDVCGPPPTVRRSTVKYTSLAVGAKAVYTCHKGFQATRTPSISCLADSTWTKVAFSCEPNTCASVKKCNAKKDGEYWIYPTLLKGASLKVYCYNMKSRSPVHYITLVKRNYANYPATRNTKCTGKDVPLPKPNKSGVTTFSKVRIYVSTMQVIRTDLRFARSTGTVHHFGVAYACHSKLNKCKKKGVAVVDFRGTGLGIKSTAVYSGGPYGSGYYSYSGSREYYKLVCGGYCGGCYMPGRIRMKRIYSPKASSATKVNC